MAELAAERLRDLLSYDPDTGHFRWKVSNSNRCKVGDIAGFKETEGRIQIRIDNKTYRAHRLAWLHTYGRWPQHQIDHINHDQSDNRLSNLREATNQENSRNMRKKNSSGLRGAQWSPRVGRWKSEIRTNSGKKFLGWFKTKEEAHSAYVKAALLHHGEFAKVD